MCESDDPVLLEIPAEIPTKIQNDNGLSRGRLIRELNRKAQEEAQAEKERKKNASSAAEEIRKRQAERAQRLEEEEKRAQAEQEAKAELYAQWKGSLEDLTEEYTSPSNVLTQKEIDDRIVAKVRSEGIVHLDELAEIAQCKMAALHDLLTRLEKEKRITGVIDERGKYIYMADEKFEELRRVVEQHGRISLNELAQLAQKLLTK